MIAEVKVSIRAVARRRRWVKRARVELLPRLTALRAELEEHRAVRRHAEHEPPREVLLLVPRAHLPTRLEVSNDEYPRPRSPIGFKVRCPEVLVQARVLRQSLDERPSVLGFTVRITPGFRVQHVVAADLREGVELPLHRRDRGPFFAVRRVGLGHECGEEVGWGVVRVELASPRVVRPGGLERQSVVLLRARRDDQAFAFFLFERPRPGRWAFGGDALVVLFERRCPRRRAGRAGVRADVEHRHPARSDPPAGPPDLRGADLRHQDQPGND